MKAVQAVLLAVALAVGAASTAGATPLRIDAVDVQSQYTGFSPVVADSGVFTFNDTFNGTNPSPERGTVTASDVAGLLSGRVDLEIVLDTSSFNPATSTPVGAPFVGTGPGPEIVIWDPTETTVLLAFDVDFIDVTVVAPFGDGSLTLGTPNLPDYGLSSQLSVSGGTLAGTVGGIGTRAVLEIIIDSPSPQLTTANLFGYLNDSFTVGIPGSPPVGQVDIAIVIPEPSVFALGATALVALVLRSRRRPA
jgi:hypothetical protein